MRINELVQKLLEISHEHGNLQVYIDDGDWRIEPSSVFDIIVKEKVKEFIPNGISRDVEYGPNDYTERKDLTYVFLGND